MMTVDDEIKQRAGQIRELLLKSCMKEALEQIRIQMSGLSDWSITSAFEDIERSYRYMLHYFSQGSPDIHRAGVYRQLVRRTLLLNDDILQARLQPKSMLIYYQHMRTRMLRHNTIDGLRAALESYTEIPDIPAHEANLNDLFDMIWTSGLWSSDEHESMQKLVESPLIHEDDAMFAVSAVTLALLERFDPLKCLFLCRESDNLSIGVSIRALTGLAVTLVHYTDILPRFPEIESRIELMADNPRIRERMLKVQMSLLMCRETKEIDRRMREEIIPIMLRNPKLGDLMTDDMERDDVSPDWMEWFETSDVKDKLMQMTELQMEGADVYMSTFANLKNYPFFRNIANWFRPFSIEQPDVSMSFEDEAFRNSPIGRSIISTTVFCNSDKYSFAFTFSQIPRSQRDLIIEQITSQIDDELDESGISADTRENLTARQYAQDLYRFFNLFARRHEFNNPFTENLNLLVNSPLSILLQTDSAEQTIAAWLLRKKYFAESVQVYNIMEKRGNPYSADYRFYQQKGYALQRIRSYSEALESYIRADILQPDNSWTLRHTAQCYRMQGESTKALELLLRAEKYSSDSLSLQIQIGDCLVDLKRYEEALSRFFKVDYLKPDYVKAWRAIAWCAFLAGRTDRSIEYYEKLLAAKPTYIDYLNAGHVYWTTGNVQQAATMYSHSIRLSDREHFEEEFHKDCEILLEKGISETDLPLMLDLI